MDEMSCKGVQLLIKNIPLNVDDKSLREVFEEHGQVLELKIKTYGWFEQKHASVYYATKLHAENAFKKLKEFSLGGNKIKANWIETEVEHSNGEVDNLETLSHDDNIVSSFVDQVNSKGNPIVLDNSKVQDDYKANPEVQDDSKVQNYSTVQDDSKANNEVHDYSKANPKLQDDSKENPKVQNYSNVQDDSKPNPMPNHDFKCKRCRNVYVSGLSQNVSKSILKAEFEKHAKVEYITILKPSKCESNCNHGYVMLDSDASAEKVIHKLNQTPIGGKMITVNWAYSKSDGGCVYISGLPLNVSEDHVRKQLEQYGRLLPQKINLLKSAEKDELHTYVTYVCQESGKKAVQAMNWSEIFGKPITVILKCDIKDSREIEKELFVDHLPPTTDKVSIREVYQKYGEVTFVRSFRGDFGMYGFVRFSSKDSAQKALAAFIGEDVLGKNICMPWSKGKTGSSSKIKDEKMKIETFEKNNDITASQELEKGRKTSPKFQAKADDVKAPSGSGKGSAASTKLFKTNTVVGKFKRQAEAANFLPFKVEGEGYTQIKTNSFGRGRGACRELDQSAGKPPPCMLRTEEDANIFSPDSMDFRDPPPNLQTPMDLRVPPPNLQTPMDLRVPPPNLQTTMNFCVPSPNLPTLLDFRVPSPNLQTPLDFRVPPPNLQTPMDLGVPPLNLQTPMDLHVPPPNLQTPTQSSTDKNFLANINHRLSSIVHKYSAMVLRPLSQEAMSGIKYVLEVSLKSEMENLTTCIRKVTKLKASVDGEENRTKKAVESLGMQLLQTLDAVDWTKLASFYNTTVTRPRAGTKMTEADILSKLRREDEMIWEAEERVNQLINHLRSIVLAFEDIEENNGVKRVLDIELEECLEKAQECLDNPVENRDEEMIVWGKNKVEKILDDIDSAWNIVQEDSDVTKLLETTENPLCLFEKKDSVKNKSLAKSKCSDLNENKSPLSTKVQHFQSKNQLKGVFCDSNLCPREKKLQTRFGQKLTVKFKSTETGFMQVQEIKTLVETHTKQHISPQMRDLLRKLDRDRDGWVFYDEFEAALTPDLLNILAKK